MFARLGRGSYRHRVVVVIVWFAALVVLGAIAGAAGSGFRSEFSLPDTESKRGFDIIEESFGGGIGGQGGSIVFRAEQGVDDPEVQAAMTAYFATVDAIDEVTLVSPYSPEGAGQTAAAGPLAGTVAFASVNLPTDIDLETAQDIAEQMKDAMPTLDGLTIEIGGQIFAEFEPPSSELLGLAFAIFILIVAFGSVLAMGLPIGVALAGIGVGTAAVTIASNVIAMPDFTTILGIMIGLGVGIDYALFIVTRWREAVHHGASWEEATVTAIDTAGRAVVFAGITVVISLLGMLLMGVSFIRGLAIGAASVVAVTMIASITLLPALLGFAKDRVEVTRWRGIIAAALVAVALIGAGLKVNVLLVGVPLAVVVLLAGFAIAPLRKELPRRVPKPIRSTFAYRYSRFVQAHPWSMALLGGGLLVLLAIPVLSLRLGFSDEGNFAEDTTTRQAYDLLAEAFGPGFNGPFVLAAELPAGTDPAVLEAVTAAVGATEGVAFASPAIPSPPGVPPAALWRVIPTTAPQDAATADLVERLRSTTLPGATAGTAVEVNVSGATAANIDFADYLAARTPIFFGVVLLLSFLLLMVVFRSLLVPLKAVVMNLLSIGAAYGVAVAIFQWGWLSGVFGVTAGAPIEPFVPMMMFAIVFGLSMDYEVFLLSRVREEFDRTGDPRTSVADGLAATAKVISAAAAIMVFVFGAFLLENDRVIKLFGVGLATAVFLDATVVRMLLVPATMELLGAKNWWLPRWLDRILPKVNVEGPAHLVDEQLHDELGEVPSRVGD